ncbi:Uncharacterised protein [Acinetobacter baumannii]|nr:Uncharacterised protein [Acinetobacter baumannii]
MIGFLPRFVASPILFSMMNPSFISLFVIEETDALFKEVILLNSALDISLCFII